MEEILKFDELKKAVPTETLLMRAEEHVTRLCATGGNSWTLRVPPDVSDPDMVFTEVCNRLKIAQEENATLRAAVKEMQRMLPVISNIELDGYDW